MVNTNSIGSFLSTYLLQVSMTQAALLILYDEFWLDQEAGERFDVGDWLMVTAAAWAITIYVGDATDLYPDGIPELRDS